MKKVLVGLFFTLFALVSLAQKKHTLKAYMDYKTFYSPEIGNYVEIYLQFPAYTIKYKPVSSEKSVGLQGELALQFKLTQDNNLVKSDSYRLNSPIMKDSVLEDFYEVKRFALKPGKYNLELNLIDLNASNNLPVTAIQEFEIKDYSKQIGISDIEAAESVRKSLVESTFSKSGYDIIPRFSDYYADDATKIPVYFEVYDPSLKVGDSSIVGLKQVIRKAKDSSDLELFTRYSKLVIKSVHPIIRAIDITNLPSGTYTLTYELISNENKVIGTKVFPFERFSTQEYAEVDNASIILDPNFQKSITDDSLEFYINSLIPISRPAEVKNIFKLTKTKDKELYRKYLQAYWTSVSQGSNTYENWIKYKSQVLLINRLFATNYTYGYETDRGRVYLQYGPPSSVTTRENSPTDYPYEIWRYDKIINMSNRRFIFYNPDLVNNVYRLLHSDVRGEVQNYRWQQQLAKRNSVNSNIDDPNDGNIDHFGGESKDLFDQY